MAEEEVCLTAAVIPVFKRATVGARGEAEVIRHFLFLVIGLKESSLVFLSCVCVCFSCSGDMVSRMELAWKGGIK